MNPDATPRRRGRLVPACGAAYDDDDVPAERAASVRTQHADGRSTAGSAASGERAASTRGRNTKVVLSVDGTACELVVRGRLDADGADRVHGATMDGRLVPAQVAAAAGVRLPGTLGSARWARLVEVAPTPRPADTALGAREFVEVVEWCAKLGWDPDSAGTDDGDASGDACSAASVAAALSVDLGRVRRSDGRSWDEVAELVGVAHRRAYGRDADDEVLWYVCCEVLPGDCHVPGREELLALVATAMSAPVRRSLAEGGDPESWAQWAWTVARAAGRVDPVLEAMVDGDGDAASLGERDAQQVLNRVCQVVAPVLAEASALG